MDTVYWIETPRLRLRCLTPEDAPALWACRNDPLCAQYQHWADTSPEAIRQWIEQFRGCQFLSQEPEQHYAICQKEGQMVGDLSWFYTPSDRCITLWYTIARPYQRKGYAFEILSALIRRAREEFPMLDLGALVEPENIPSIRLLEKLGFQQECWAEKIHSFIYSIPAENQNGADAL